MKIIIMLLITFFVLRIPILGKYLRVVNTMIHESGHAIAALLTSGKVYSISLFTNTEGLAVTGSRYWLGRVIVAISGYIFSSFFAFLTFYLYFENKYEWILYILATFCLVNMVLWVRNFYGFIWLVTFTTLLVISYLFLTPLALSYFTLIICSILLTESVTTSFVILKLSHKQPDKAGDAKSLKEATFIPTIIWGLFFFIQSLYFSYLVIRQII